MDFFRVSLNKKPRLVTRAGFKNSNERSLARDNADSPATARALNGVNHLTGHFGEQGVVLADANILPRMKLGATLSHEYIPGEHLLTGVAFNAQTFSM
jgi:hypothetical protein